MNKHIFNKILKNVDKPARYIGEEKNSIIKDFDNTSVRFAFCFPDTYEIGMSHLGMHLLYFLINEQEDYLCERVFAPWIDMEAELRKNNYKLFSLENKKPLDEFDIVGFTLQYEMSYTNILNMMELGGIPLRANDRDDSHPLVIAGGPTAYNPEPLADFFDLFIIGEGEEVNLELFQLYKEHKDRGFVKNDFLIEAAKIEGIYIPAFYNVEYNEDGTINSYKKEFEYLPDKITKRRVRDLNNTFSLGKLIVPYIEIVHQRSVVEIFRGCTQGCRFCEAGYIYRPVREKSIETILDAVNSQIEFTGYNEVSLSSLSSCDYSGLKPLVSTLIEKYEDKKVRISLPSLRIDSLSMDVLKEIEKVKKTGLTLAPEAGSQRMRDVINKNVTEEDFREALTKAYESGWSKIKLYFMIGLPTETLEDIDGIKEMSEIAKDLFFKRPKEEIRGDFQVTLSSSCFVPKPFTPFQWEAQDTIENLFEKIYHLKDSIRDRKVKFQYHDPNLSILEGYVSRGDRRIGSVIESAYKKGAKFDGWSDQFKFDSWIEAMEENNLPLEFYSYRERGKDEILPWDIIDPGVNKEYLLRELIRAKKMDTTRDCRISCNYCGIENCEMRV